MAVATSFKPYGIPSKNTISYTIEFIVPPPADKKIRIRTIRPSGLWGEIELIGEKIRYFFAGLNLVLSIGGDSHSVAAAKP